MTTPVLTLAGLTKRYGPQPVWADLSLNIAAGTCVGLVGVNGAGKTTLFRSILDLCCVDAGTIDICGLSHLDTASHAHLAYLPERFHPPSELNGMDFLHYSLALAKVNYDARRMTVLATQLHIEIPMLKRPVRQLSKGTAQKLGLLAVWLMNKELNLLDEPMSGLDPLAQRDVKQALSELKKSGAAVLMSTHALHDIQAMCDRMLVLHQGRICFDGTPSDFISLSPMNDVNDTLISFLQANQGRSGL